jgi:4-amino-4-deoxy-L-arabinose transferase-like glycosyltransferase
MRRMRGPGWALWILLAVAWFATLPMRPLLDPDEGRYAEIPREMLTQGDWVTPRLDGLKYFEKPPLQYWATAAIYSVAGVTEWTARLWTVGLSFLCLPMVFGWTARLFGRAAGLAALTALAVSPYFGLIAHLNLLDGGFAFWLSGTLFAFTLAQCAPVGSASERRWMMVTWLAAALAVLTKGIVVGVLAGAALVAYTVIERDFRPWRRLHVMLGFPLFLLVAAPWFILVSLRNPSFPEFFFVHEHFARFLTAVHQRVEPWWFFPALLLLGALPWLLAVPGASRRAWFDTTPGIPFKPLKFLLLFSVITVVFFSLSESKLAPYILPMMPALAAVMGAYLADRPYSIRWISRFVAVFVPLIAVAFMVWTMRRYGFLPSSSVQWLAAAAVASVWGLFASWKEPGTATGPVWMTAAGAILSWQCLLSGYSELPERSAHKMVMTIKPLIGPRTELFSIGQYRETLSPYLQRTLTLVQFEGELAFGLAEEPGSQLTREQFLARWNAASDAVVFLNPSLLDDWRKAGLQGKVIGGDNDTLAVSRL